jgi:16S rRNA (uracil1498-N3)-methyltransferase
LTDAASSGFAATVYVPEDQFAGPTAEVSGEAYRHLFKARRLRAGDRLRAVDGGGHAREARVEKIDRRAAQLELGRELTTHEPLLRLTLLVAAPRPERASWLVEKATELGAAAVRWLRSERAPRKLGVVRHRRVALAAMQQCGGARLPEISGPHDWDELEELVAPVDAAFALDPEGGAGPDREIAGAAGVVVGPEGGWTLAERRRLAELDCLPWSLGTRILRIETAALVAASWLLRAAKTPPSE